MAGITQHRANAREGIGAVLSLKGVVSRDYSFAIILILHQTSYAILYKYRKWYYHSRIEMLHYNFLCSSFWFILFYPCLRGAKTEVTGWIDTYKFVI